MKTPQPVLPYCAEHYHRNWVIKADWKGQGFREINVEREKLFISSNRLKSTKKPIDSLVTNTFVTLSLILIKRLHTKYFNWINIPLVYKNLSLKVRSESTFRVDR